MGLKSFEITKEGNPYLCKVEFVEIEKIRQTLLSFASEKVLLAHSGGIDSSVLAHLLQANQIVFSVAHCNFQLRVSASDKDEDFVKNWCATKKVPFFSKRFDTEAYKKRTKESTQLAARNLRYQWFEELRNSHGFTVLLTGHHLNDQFETFLMHSTRGTGISGLLGIPETDWIRRPLKKVSKTEIVAYAKQNQISWREDASNASDDYLRNAFRNQLVEPWLKKYPEHLSNFKTTLDHLTAANSFIQSQMDRLQQQLFKEHSFGLEINIHSFEQIPQSTFCAHYWFAPLGFVASEVVKLVKAPKGKMLFSNTHRLIREREVMVLTPLIHTKDEYYILNLNKNSLEFPVPLYWETLSQSSKGTWKPQQAALDKSVIKKPLHLRKYKKGDYFYPTGMKGKKMLSKFFKDEKFTTLEKEAQWLLCDSNDAIVWVVGKRCDKRYAAKEATAEILLMTLSL